MAAEKRGFQAIADFYATHWGIMPLDSAGLFDYFAEDAGQFEELANAIASDASGRAARRLYKWMATEQRYAAACSYRWMEIVTGAAFIDEVMEKLGPQKNVVDIGGGCGQWAHWATRYGVPGHVIEREKALVRLGRRMHASMRTGVTMSCADISKCEAPGSVSTLVSVQGLWSELLRGQWGVLGGISELLALNGHAILVDIGGGVDLRRLAQECLSRSLHVRGAGLSGGCPRGEGWGAVVGLVLEKADRAHKVVPLVDAVEMAKSKWTSFMEFANLQDDWRNQNTAAWRSSEGVATVEWYW